MLIKQNTIVFIILVLAIAICVIASCLILTHNDSNLKQNFQKDDEENVFVVKQGLAPSLQMLFEDQRDINYNLSTVCGAGSCYNVRTDIEDVPETIRIFGEIDLMIEQLTYCMQKKYLGTPEKEGKPAKPPKVKGDSYRSMLTQNILERYRKENMIENSTRNRTLTSFVTDKGRLIAICTRTKSGTGKHHSLALLKFVALHELAHIANSMPGTENHGPEFWRTFKMILLEARENGLCTELLTENGTITYCNGLKMNNSNLNLDKIKV